MQVAYRSIQTMPDDVPAHCLRYEIVDGFTCCEARANRRRRHVTRPSLHEEYECVRACDRRRLRTAQPRSDLGRPRGGGIERRSGPRDHDEVRGIEYRGELAPRRNFCKRIGTENEEKLRRVPPLAPERGERVRGVRRAVAPQFHVRRAIRLVPVDGQGHEREPMKRARTRIRWTMGWVV